MSSSSSSSSGKPPAQKTKERAAAAAGGGGGGAARGGGGGRGGGRAAGNGGKGGTAGPATATASSASSAPAHHAQGGARGGGGASRATPTGGGGGGGGRNGGGASETLAPRGGGGGGRGAHRGRGGAGAAGGGAQQQPQPQRPPQQQQKAAAWSNGARPEALRLTTEQAEEQERRARAAAEAEAEVKQEEQRQLAVRASADRMPSPRTRKILDAEVEGVMARPSTGTRGRVISISCNHFPFALKLGTVYQYSIEFKPEVDSKSARIRYLHQHEDVLGVPIFDGGSMLFLTRPLDEIELLCKARDDSEVRMRIVLAKQLTEPSMHLAGLIFHKILRMLRLKPIGRQYFDPTRPIEVPQHKVQLWPGYFSSVVPNNVGIMLVADVAHKVLRTDTVLELISEAYRTRRQGVRQFIEQQLIGSIVITRYNNRTYRIDDIDWNKNPRNKFTKRSGEQITYIDYYKATYNRSMISDFDQPLLLHRHRRRGADDELIYLIPELCSMTGLTDDMRQDFNVMSDLAKYTRVEPGRRKKEVVDFITSINQNTDVKTKLIDGWGLSISPTARTLQARVLGSEKLTFGNNFTMQVDATAEWMQASSRRQVIKGIPLLKWLFIYSNRARREAEDFSEMITQVGRDIGLQVAPAEAVEIDDDRPATYVAAVKQHLTDDMQIVVFLINGSRKDVYDKMKQLFCLDLSIPSQAILTRSIKNPKRVMSVCKNILLQINCKQGGELWRVDIPLPGKTMIVGIDVYHDTGPGKKKRSVAGFIATTNATFTKYYSRVAFQEQGQELVGKLGACMVDALRHYFKVNGSSLPDRIIVYRDGVGDGQLAAVLDQEVPQLQEAFAELGPSYKPKLAFVVVKKRIHSRLFASMPQGGITNPQPGTVVDTDIVHPNWYDFFLVSQYVRQGTVTPTHYHVILDNTGLTPDHMQALTYKLCHLYYNWPGTIRVPAPCQYAHKIAFLVGQSLHKQPAAALADRLYFL